MPVTNTEPSNTKITSLRDALRIVMIVPTVGIAVYGIAWLVMRQPAHERLEAWLDAVAQQTPQALAAKPNSLANLLESKRYGRSLWYSIS